jgi:hypothetical protein
VSTDRAAPAGASEIREHGARLERALLACGVIGPPLFVAVFVAESLVHPPGYDPLRYTVSAFVLGAFGWVQVATFLVAGGLLLAFAFGLRPALGGGRLVAVLVGLFAVGMIGSGVFAADRISSGVTADNPYPPGTLAGPDRTLHGILHDLLGVPVFLGLPIICGIVAYRFVTAGRKGWAAYSAGTAVAYVTCFVLTSMALAQPSLIAPVGGLLQRFTIIVGWTWLAALALHLLRRAPDAARTIR